MNLEFLYENIKKRAERYKPLTTRIVKVNPKMSLALNPAIASTGRAQKG